jgi:hypothetical protein
MHDMLNSHAVEADLLLPGGVDWTAALEVLKRSSRLGELGKWRWRVERDARDACVWYIR